MGARSSPLVTFGCVLGLGLHACLALASLVASVGTILCG